MNIQGLVKQNKNCFYMAPFVLEVQQNAFLHRIKLFWFFQCQDRMWANGAGIMCLEMIALKSTCTSHNTKTAFFWCLLVFLKKNDCTKKKDKKHTQKWRCFAKLRKPCFFLKISWSIYTVWNTRQNSCKLISANILGLYILGRYSLILFPLGQSLRLM